MWARVSLSFTKIILLPKQIKYPFWMSSTANYRGHIGVWQIESDSLFLNEILRWEHPEVLTLIAHLLS